MEINEAKLSVCLGGSPPRRVGHPLPRARAGRPPTSHIQRACTLSVCLGGSPARRVDGRKKAARCAGGGTPLAVFSADSTGFTSLNFEQFEQFDRFERFDPFDRVVQIDDSAGSVKSLGRFGSIPVPTPFETPGHRAQPRHPKWIGQMVELDRPNGQITKPATLFDGPTGRTPV